jgi:hypothetical protein
MARRPVLDPDTYVAAEDVLVTEFGSETVLLNLQDGVYYGLEDSGALVWTLLRQPVTVADIRDAVVAAYDVDPARCERDIRSLITDLADRQLIKRRDSR